MTRDSRKRWKLDFNERADGAPAWAAEALKNLSPDLLWQYPNPHRISDALAQHFDLAPDQVLVTQGGDESIYQVMASLPRDARVVIPRPCFGVYPMVARILGLTDVAIPAMPDFAMDLNALVQALHSRERVDLLVLARPNNPTGEQIPMAMVQSLAMLCESRNTLFLLDEAYVDYAGNSALESLSVFSKLIILRTFSKAYGLAGLRLGYLLGAAKTLRPVRRRLLPFNVTNPSVALGLCALEDSAQSEMRQYAARVVEQRETLRLNLRDWGVTAFPGEANFLFLHLGEVRAEWVFEVLAWCGITVRRFQRDDLQGCLRITIPADATALTDALKLALKPDLICLDVDDTLIDTGPSFDEAVKKVVHHFSGRNVAQDVLRQTRFKGGLNDDWELAREILRHMNVDVSLDQVVDLGQRFYWGSDEVPGLCEREVPLIHSDNLRKLQTDFELAFVTGRNRREWTAACRQLGLQDDAFAVTMDDVSCGKPDPQGVRMAKAHFRAKTVWMVGDNVDDVSAARCGGALPVAVGPNVEPLKAAGAVAVWPDINAIASVLGWEETP